MTNKHPAVASGIGALIGVLTLLEGFFATGGLPTGTQIASVLAGSGVALGSLIAFIAAHVHLARIDAARTPTAPTAVTSAANTTPAVTNPPAPKP